MSENLIYCGIALIGFERLRRSLDARYWLLDTGCWPLVTGNWSLDAGLWYKAEGLSRQPSSRYGVTMARQAGLKLQGIKIRPLTFFNSAFRIPNSEFNCICLLLFCYQFVAVLHIGIADHDVRIQSRFLQGLIFSDAHGGVIDRLAGPNG